MKLPRVRAVIRDGNVLGALYVGLLYHVQLRPRPKGENIGISSVIPLV